MSGAAQEHLNTVTNAISETETLRGEIRNIKPAIEEAAGAIVTVIDTLVEKIAVITAQADTVTTNTQQARSAAETHVGSITGSGHGTKAYADQAEEACQTADAHATALKDFLDTLLGAIKEAESTAAADLMRMIPEVETGTAGASVISERLEEAQAQINAAIHAGNG